MSTLGSGLDARILDRGYRRYQGDRLGVPGAVRSLVRHSIQRALGLRRSAWAKLLPLLVIAISYVPAIVFVGIAALIPDAENQDFGEEFVLPTYGEYFNYITAAVILFVAFVAPEVLCTDRRTGMLGLYLASPLTRDTYLVAKAIAVGIVLGFVTIGPPLLMLVANVLQSNGPDGPGGVLLTLLRIVASGAAISAMFTAISLAASSLTERKAFATAGLILLFLVSSVVAGTLGGLLELGDNFFLLNLFYLPFEVVGRIHGEAGGTVDGDLPDVSTIAAFAAAFGWTVLGAVIVRTRYRLLQVTR